MLVGLADVDQCWLGPVVEGDIEGRDLDFVGFRADLAEQRVKARHARRLPRPSRKGKVRMLRSGK
jgi:hypothetical protein